MKGVLDRVKGWFGPRDEAPEGEPAFDMAPEDEVLTHEGAGARVLVAEASARMRALYADYLTSLGYAFRIVASGEALEEALDAYGPEVLVLDHRPPHVLGFRLAAEVKGTRAELPVVICSAWALDTVSALLETDGGWSASRPLWEDFLAASSRSALLCSSQYSCPFSACFVQEASSAPTKAQRLEVVLLVVVVIDRSFTTDPPTRQDHRFSGF